MKATRKSVNWPQRSACPLVLRLVRSAGGRRSRSITSCRRRRRSRRWSSSPWCEKIGKESGGRIKCQIYPAMQLGGTPPQLFDQARDGVADIVWTVPTYQAGRFVKSEVFELPFMAKNAETGSPALWEYVQKNSLDEFKGVKLLAMHLHDGSLLHFANKRVTNLDELKGLKVRAPTRIGTKFLTAIGAVPVQMPVPQVTESLSEGRDRRRDGAVGGRAGDQAAGGHEVPPRHGAGRRPRCRTRSSSSR